MQRIVMETIPYFCINEKIDANVRVRTNSEHG